MFLSFCFSSSEQHSSSEINMCRVYLHQVSMRRLNQNIGKTCIYPSFWKSYSTSCKGIGGHKKKKFVKVKPQHWHFKRSDNIKAVKTGVALKVLCYWQSKISELRHSVLEILSFWNKFWMHVFCDSQKRSSSTENNWQKIIGLLIGFCFA